jgi:molybdopterin/thiamine biosynthesis adenylyltransferase/rhodanese-related sulfurtransferase
MSKLSKEQTERYSRHILLGEIGTAGQEKLRDSSVLIVGVGGLGSPAALYLAAAGVGRIGLVDPDTVSLSNLQRQILYSTHEAGEAKTAAAQRRLQKLKSDITIETYPFALDSGNASAIIRKYDVIIDGSDNFATRYLVNDVCVFEQKPYVYGSIYRFDGQITVFDAQKGPCYRCLFPNPPQPFSVPACGQTGVLGVLPGTIGVLQAGEALKLILNLGQPLTGRLILYDALSLRFDEVAIQKSPACPVCGRDPQITAPIDYQLFCKTVPPADLPPARIMTVQELQRRLTNSDKLFLLDVREDSERAISRIDNAAVIPMGQISGRLNEIPDNCDVVVFCRSGVRSAHVVNQLSQAGFQRIFNLDGGILAWAGEIAPEMASY